LPLRRTGCADFFDELERAGVRFESRPSPDISAEPPRACTVVLVRSGTRCSGGRAARCSGAAARTWRCDADAQRVARDAAPRATGRAA
jgi:hypothetical protein